MIITQDNIPDTERTLLCLVNVYRSSKGAQVLTQDPHLEAAARGHSEYMEAHNSTGHDDIGDGTPTSRAKAQGFVCNGDCVAENIASSHFPGTTPNDLLAVWKGNSSQNAIMSNPTYVTAGMGFALGPHLATTGTQNFAPVSNGATDTAADLLTSPKCDDAQDVAAALAKRLEKDQKRLDATKKGTDHRKRAKAKVRKDKKKADAAAADADNACDLTY